MTQLGSISLLLLGVSIGFCYGTDSSDNNSSAIENIVRNKAEKSDIEEPCKDSNDVKECVRDFFQQHGQCSVVRDNDEKEEPFILTERPTLYAAIANIFVNLVNTRVSNLDGDIEAFYINKNTGNLVMSIRLTNFTIESKNARIGITQRSIEPFVIISRVGAYYPISVVTAVIPVDDYLADEDSSNLITKWTLQKSLFSAVLPESEIEKVLMIGDNFTNSSDPVVVAAAKTIQSNLPTIHQEFALTGAPNIFLAYLQRYICNFGASLPF